MGQYWERNQPAFTIPPRQQPGQPIRQLSREPSRQSSGKSPAQDMYKRYTDKDKSVCFYHADTSCVVNAAVNFPPSVQCIEVTLKLAKGMFVNQMTLRIFYG